MLNLNEKHTSLLQEKNFIIQKCSHCHKEMSIGTGDIIFGEKWFHLLCWRKEENYINEHTL